MDLNMYVAEYWLKERMGEVRAAAMRDQLVQSLRTRRRPLRVTVGQALVSAAGSARRAAPRTRRPTPAARRPGGLAAHEPFSRSLARAAGATSGRRPVAAASGRLDQEGVARAYGERRLPWS